MQLGSGGVSSPTSHLSPQAVPGLARPPFQPMWPKAWLRLRWEVPAIWEAAKEQKGLSLSCRLPTKHLCLDAKSQQGGVRCKPQRVSCEAP